MGSEDSQDGGTSDCPLNLFEKDLSDRAEFIIKFFWEFTKLINDELPKYIGKNE